MKNKLLAVTLTQSEYFQIQIQIILMHCNVLHSQTELDPVVDLGIHDSLLQVL